MLIPSFIYYIENSFRNVLLLKVSVLVLVWVEKSDSFDVVFLLIPYVSIVSPIVVKYTLIELAFKQSERPKGFHSQSGQQISCTVISRVVTLFL